MELSYGGVSLTYGGVSLTYGGGALDLLVQHAVQRQLADSPGLSYGALDLLVQHAVQRQLATTVVLLGGLPALSPRRLRVASTRLTG
jgi:hypothetical protein